VICVKFVVGCQSSLLHVEVHHACSVFIRLRKFYVRYFVVGVGNGDARLCGFCLKLPQVFKGFVVCFFDEGIDCRRLRGGAS